MKWSATPNHVAIAVDDLDATEQRIKAAGIETFNHANDDPGRRFYFRDGDDIEFEVVSDT
ncbi:VOC family protein [Thalassospira lucentensis]|uniref:VOC family protein n=1 Tax=Thalassospira lucentensis TaxID=168935 RepID=UPI003AA86341